MDLGPPSASNLHATSSATSSSSSSDPSPCSTSFCPSPPYLHGQHAPSPSTAPAARSSASAAAAALAAALLLLGGPTALLPGPAHALLTSPNAQIARSVDAALRRAIPAFNPEVAKLQKDLEDIQYLLRIPQRKPWGSMAASVASALQTAADEPARRAALLEGAPDAASSSLSAPELADQLLKRLQQLDLAIRTQQPDLAGLRVAQALQAVSQLELLQAPGLPYSLPKDFTVAPNSSTNTGGTGSTATGVRYRVPVLTGRATVELRVEKQDGSTSFVDSVNGGLTNVGKVRIVLDGYSAPVSAGNFAANVQDKLYDGTPVQASYSSLYVQSKKEQERPPIPLEILPLGEFDPVYRVPLDVRSGELPVLPLSIPGAVSMAHVPGSDSYLSGEEWFVFKFDKQQAGLSGLAFDEGTFGVFGYVTEGMDDVVAKLQSGDVIVSARLVEGADKLVRPDRGDQQQAPPIVVTRELP